MERNKEVEVKELMDANMMRIPSSTPVMPVTPDKTTCTTSGCRGNGNDIKSSSSPSYSACCKLDIGNSATTKSSSSSHSGRHTAEYLQQTTWKLLGCSDPSANEVVHSATASEAISPPLAPATPFKSRDIGNAETTKDSASQSGCYTGGFPLEPVWKLMAANHPAVAGFMRLPCNHTSPPKRVLFNCFRSPAECSSVASLPDLNSLPLEKTPTKASEMICPPLAPVTPFKSIASHGESVQDELVGRCCNSNENDKLQHPAAEFPTTASSQNQEAQQPQSSLFSSLDLNETRTVEPNPEMGQKLKRKKHRAKVIREGSRAERTPLTQKPVTPKSLGNQTAKRTYTRKKEIKCSLNPTSELPEETAKRTHTGKKEIKCSLNTTSELPEETSPRYKRQRNFAECTDATSAWSSVQDGIVNPPSTPAILVQATYGSTSEPVKRKLNFELEDQMVSPKEAARAARKYRALRLKARRMLVMQAGQGLRRNLTLETISHKQPQDRTPPFQLDPVSRREKIKRNWKALARDARNELAVQITTSSNNEESMQITTMHGHLHHISMEDQPSSSTATGAILPYVRQNDLAVVQGSSQQLTVVPFQKINRGREAKKKLCRAKVDLDEETKQLFELIMSNKGSEDGSCEDKRWDEERRIFQGRVDLFISKMNLIQGDRRFSKWKGSVLDSVIGVFLTQNVTDNLSSSAFMALASKFPVSLSTGSSVSCPASTSTITENRVNLPSDTSHLQEETEKRANDSTTTNHMCAIVDDKDLQTKELDTKAGLEKSNCCSEKKHFINSVPDASAESLHDDDLKLMTETLAAMLRENCQISTVNSESPSYETHIENAGVPLKQVIDTHKNSISASPLKFSAVYQEVYEMIDACASQHIGFDNLQDTNLQASGKVTNTLQPSNIGLAGEVVNQEHQFGYKQELLYSQGDAGASLENMGFVNPDSTGKNCYSVDVSKGVTKGESKSKTTEVDWDSLRKEAYLDGYTCERSIETMDSIDWEAVSQAGVSEVAEAIQERGMSNVLAGRIKDLLNRLKRDHGSLDLEWLRKVPPEKTKDYLLSIRGLGLKSVECVRLLSLEQHAFPVDTNVGRICVRLGWVPIEPLPEEIQFYLVELYPVQQNIQKYLWPRLCKLDKRTLYELHYQLITFGKVFCTKRRPNCNACPLKGECKHFASAFASVRLALPGPEAKTSASVYMQNSDTVTATTTTESFLLIHEGRKMEKRSIDLNLPLVRKESEMVERVATSCVPMIEYPSSPEPPWHENIGDVEDIFNEDPDKIIEVNLNLEGFQQNFLEERKDFNEDVIQKALVAIRQGAASIPVPPLKNVSRLRTEHQAYELPDDHPLLQDLDPREHDDPCPYLLIIWTPGEMVDSTERPKTCCDSQYTGKLCEEKACFACNAKREEQAQIVRGTLLTPCRTAMRGRFPLNGTYFQVNEVFADHQSSYNPIHVPRTWIWNLERRSVLMGTGTTAIFAGRSLEEIQSCFRRGFMCIRGFDYKTRAPKPLCKRLHFAASRDARIRGKTTNGGQWTTKNN